MSAFQMPSPVILSSQCSVNTGSSASPNMSELSYPYRKAILIDEIRFDLWATGNATTDQLGAVVYARFQLGQHYLMRDPVPVWLLGTLMDLREEQSRDNFLGTAQEFSHYRWHLPEPLYVEAGSYLQPVFTLNPAATLVSNLASITVQVTYCGRVLPPLARRPSKIIVPYAAPFVTTPSVTGGYQQSNEYNLLNPFNTPLLIQRFTGRLLGTEGASPGMTPPASGTSRLTLQMFDSWGDKIVNDLTGPGDVFDLLRGAWTFDTVLPPKGVYLVRAFNLSQPTPGAGGVSQLQMAMIGSREERP